MKIVKIVSKVIFIICLPVLFLTSSLAWGFNSLWLYEYGFQKFQVSQSTGLSESDLHEAGKALIDYFNSSDEYIHVTVTKNGQTFELFNQAEQIHFRDVKLLVILDYRVAIISFLIVLAYVLAALFWRKGKYRRYLAISFLWGSGLAIILIVVLGAASLLDFNQLFLQFHYLVFTNSYWSAEGYMLLLFPGGFWFDAAIICIAFMAFLALLSGGIALIYLKLNKPANTLAG